MGRYSWSNISSELVACSDDGRKERVGISADSPHPVGRYMWLALKECGHNSTCLPLRRSAQFAIREYIGKRSSGLLAHPPTVLLPLAVPPTANSISLRCETISSSNPIRLPFCTVRGTWSLSPRSPQTTASRKSSSDYWHDWVERISNVQGMSGFKIWNEIHNKKLVQFFL